MGILLAGTKLCVLPYLLLSMASFTTIKITTVNIGGMRSQVRFSALSDFLVKSDIAVAGLQEVGFELQNAVPGYQLFLNASHNRTGTAILVRDGVSFSNVQYHPSNRIIVGDLYGVKLVNLYSPAGSNRRQERNHFFPVI